MDNLVYWQPAEKRLPVLFGTDQGEIVSDDEDTAGQHLVKTSHGMVVVPAEQLRRVL